MKVRKKNKLVLSETFNNRVFAVGTNGQLSFMTGAEILAANFTQNYSLQASVEET